MACFVARPMVRPYACGHARRRFGAYRTLSGDITDAVVSDDRQTEEMAHEAMIGQYGNCSMMMPAWRGFPPMVMPGFCACGKCWSNVWIIAAANLCGQTVEAAWLALGGPACIEDATDLEDAAAYLDYLEANENESSVLTVAALEEGLVRLFALPDVKADDTLQIMTIHKAKGLEFDHVIVPGLGRSSRGNDKKLFMWMEYLRPALATEEPSEGNDLLLAPIQETGGEADRIYSWLEKLDGEKERLEDGRLLYVAATRARQRLHLLGSAGVREGAALLNLLN